ncbi:MAG: DUF4430 domain-containing protein [Dehalococcoidia bacterium]|nr:DUF4430 domain-containing protein [Dehalococcoidia bacterium]
MKLGKASFGKLVAPVLIVFLLVIFATGCQSGSSNRIDITVVVTRDFGEELVLEKAIVVDGGCNAMDALRQVSLVETMYGGGFVHSIAGIPQPPQDEAQKAWFLYINGISSDVGALDYELCDGDVEHWDFHQWNFRPFVPAIVGDFPQPFLSGYRGDVPPTLVVYGDGFQGEAYSLAGTLHDKGVESAQTKAATDLSAEERESSNLILVGTEGLGLISQVNDEYDDLGLFIRFGGNGTVISYSPEGEIQCEASCGFIQATQNAWNPGGIGACRNVVWIVSGTDDAQIREAVDLLAGNYQELRYECAVMLVNGTVIKVPHGKLQISG